MFGWIFGTQQNSHYREVTVTSSRYGSKKVKVYGDSSVGQIKAINAVAKSSLSTPEPGETIEIKAYFD